MVLSFPSSPTDGQIYTDSTGVKWVYNASKQRWARYAQHLTGTFVQSTAPTATAAGQFWYDTANALLKVWSGSSWETASGPAVKVSPIPPLGVEGDLWFDTTDNILYVYTTEWTIAGGQTGHVVADAPPATANEGDQWEDTTDGTISYWDATNETWVQASHPEKASAEFTYFPEPQQVIIVRANDSVESYSAVTNISPYFKGNGSTISALSTGDAMYLGTGTYIWEGMYVPTPATTPAGYAVADWQLPSEVSIMCPVKCGARIKLCQGKSTYINDGGTIKRAMTGSEIDAFPIPFFQQAANPTGSGIIFKGIIFDCNAKENIEIYNNPEIHPPEYPYYAAERRAKGLRTEYVFMRARGGSARKFLMEDCQVVGWTTGGIALTSDATYGPQFMSAELFVFDVSDAVVRRCIFSDPHSSESGVPDPDVNGVRDYDDAYRRYFGITVDNVLKGRPYSTIYCTVIQPYQNCLFEGCIVEGPETLPNDPTNTNWWRIINQPWMVYGLKGNREVAIFAFALPAGGGENTLKTVFKDCIAKRVTHAFHRDTYNMSPTEIINCIGYGCVKGVRNIVNSDSTSFSLKIEGCEFHVVDILNGGLHNLSNVDNDGSGMGHDACIYLDARSSTSGSNVATIKNTTIKNCYFTTYQGKKASDDALPYRTGGQAVRLVSNGGADINTVGRIYGCDFSNNRIKTGVNLKSYREVLASGTQPLRTMAFDPNNYQRGSDLDAIDYLSLSLKEGAPVTPEKEKLVEEFIATEKAAGTWSSIKRLYYLGWNRITANRIDMVTRKTASSTAGLSVATGYMTSTSGVIKPDTAGSLTAVGASGSNLSVFAVLVTAAAEDGYAIGLNTASSDSYAGILSDQINSRVSFAGPSATVANLASNSSDTTRTGVYVGVSESTASRFLVVHKAATSTFTNTNSSTNTLPDVTPFIFGRNEGGSGLQPYIGSIGLAGYGTKMTQSAAQGFAARLKTFWEKMSGLTLT